MVIVTSKESESKINHTAATGDFNGNVPNMQVFNLAEIEATTDKLSIENKLGEGGYGLARLQGKLVVNYIYMWHCCILMMERYQLIMGVYLFIKVCYKLRRNI